MNFKQYNVYVHKAADTLFSTKFSIFLASSIFLMVNKISADNWVTVATALAGFHTMNTMTSIVKGTKKLLPKGDEIDDPDA